MARRKRQQSRREPWICSCGCGTLIKDRRTELAHLRGGGPAAAQVQRILQTDAPSSDFDFDRSLSSSPSICTTVSSIPSSLLCSPELRPVSPLPESAMDAIFDDSTMRDDFSATFRFDATPEQLQTRVELEKEGERFDEDFESEDEDVGNGGLDFGFGDWAWEDEFSREEGCNADLLDLDPLGALGGSFEEEAAALRKNCLFFSIYLFPDFSYFDFGY